MEKRGKRKLGSWEDGKEGKKEVMKLGSWEDKREMSNDKLQMSNQIQILNAKLEDKILILIVVTQFIPPFKKRAGFIGQCLMNQATTNIRQRDNNVK